MKNKLLFWISVVEETGLLFKRIEFQQDLESTERV
jgi:hypothetical protein